MALSGNTKDQKIGLVLGSGAVRGLAQIGIIKAMVERNISIDVIAGTSIGAIVGACYARMLTKSKDFRSTFSKMSWDDLYTFADLNLDSILRGFFRVGKVLSWLKDVFGDLAFSDLDIPLAIVTTDLRTGEEVVIREGSVLDAVMASISIPSIFTPVKVGKHTLIDGAFVNPVPVNVARDLGASFLIACDTTGSLPGKDKRQETKRLVRMFSRRNKHFAESAGAMFKLLKQTIHYMESGIVKSQLHKADIVISPHLDDIDMLAFSQSQEVIVRGYDAAHKTLAAALA